MNCHSPWLRERKNVRAEKGIDTEKHHATAKAFSLQGSGETLADALMVPTLLWTHERNTRRCADERSMDSIWCKSTSEMKENCMCSRSQR
jgi:hypothetical protein